MPYSDVIGKAMKQKTDLKLDRYSRVDFKNDLRNLEGDVTRRLARRQRGHIDLNNLMVKWFGLPAFFSGGAIALTMVLGVFMGTQMQTDLVLDSHDTFGFQVFSATSGQLPSSLLASNK